MTTAIAIIPARGGSKGIPRKSIRPVAGRPMIAWAMEACQRCARFTRIVVSTDDPEIALLSERLGAQVLMRPIELATDTATLDPVVVQAVSAAEAKFEERYDLVFTVQPTSPLVEPGDFERAFEMFGADPALETVLSVVDDRHLSWTMRGGRPVPTYTKRVNRQELAPNFRETGAVIACRRAQLESGTRIGERVALLEMPPMRAFDIDSVADLAVCEAMLLRKRIVFAVIGYPEVGLGHASRATMLAHELVRHDLRFVCESRSGLAAEYIGRQNWNVEIAPQGGLLRAVLAHRPHLVINDLLDTDAGYVMALKDAGCRVANFEDLGDGAMHADLVVNALYPYGGDPAHVLVGPRWFCLRDEFLYTGRSAPRQRVERLLVTFGGVDEGNLTVRVIRLLAPLAAARGILLDAVVGAGYAHGDALAHLVSELQEAWPALRIEVTGATGRISDHMCDADLAVTSGGRTVFELASLAVPTVVICQNQREATHTFAVAGYHVVNLGWRGTVGDAEIVAAVTRLVDDGALRERMRQAAFGIDLTLGKRRVVGRLLGLLEDSRID